MAPEKLGNSKRTVINTGNILSLNDITRKSGQNPTEELTEAINITLNEALDEAVPNGRETWRIRRWNDDLESKMGEEPLSNLKIGLKIFLNSDRELLVRESLEEAFLTLKVPNVHNVIIAYRKNPAEMEGDVGGLKKVWSVLEGYVAEEKIHQIGLADVEEATFRNIYEWAKVKPAIIQINLATCCVVPPTLQEFCKDNDVQLLTHSDPADILPADNVQDIFRFHIPNNQLKWVLRFLVHIKCRGVLITKGYLVGLSGD